MGEVNEVRWDYSGDHPYRLYFTGHSIPNSQAASGENVATSFYYVDIDPVSGVQSVPVLIHDFSVEFPLSGTYPTGGYSSTMILNDVEGDSSNDSRYWTWQVRGPYDHSSYDLSTALTYKRYAIIVYDKTTNSLVGRFQRDCAGVSGVCTVYDTPSEAYPYIPAPNMTESSPLGVKAIVDWGRASSNPSVLSGTWVNVGGNIWSLTGYKALTSSNSVFGKFSVDGVRFVKVGSGTGGTSLDIVGENQYTVNNVSNTIYVQLAGGIDPNTKTVIADWGSRPDDLGTIADGPKACSKDFSECFRIGNSEEHSGWAWGLGGEEMFVSQNSGNDYIESVDITSSTSAACNLISTLASNKVSCGIKIARLYPTFSKSGDSSYPVSVHFGKVYDQNKRGWALLDTAAGYSDTWFANQIIFMEIKAFDAVPAPREWRVSPTFNTTYDYRSEGSGALNFDGTQVWVTANFGLPKISNANEVYSVFLPENWHDVLTGADVVAPAAPSGLSVQ
ncbi:MAG: hypothetical protein WCI36_01190 [bacterium]